MAPLGLHRGPRRGLKRALKQRVTPDGATGGCGTIHGHVDPTRPPRSEPHALVLYEYPFNEGIRTMLRLEHLFDRLGQLVVRETPVDHHFALVTIFEIMDVASRADLKSDLL